MKNLKLKKFFLYLLICSISCSALMGIWAIISGEFGELQQKILLTTLTAVTTSIFGLACGSYFESPHSQNSPLKLVPTAGIFCSLLAAFTSFLLIWEFFNFNDIAIYKTFFISLIFAFSLAQLSLLSLAHLGLRFTWSLTAAYVVILLLDSIISIIIIGEFNEGGDFITRIIGVLSVIAASLTVMIPIFHRLSRADFAEAKIPSVLKIDEEITNLKTRIAYLEKQKEDISGSIS